MDTLSTLLRFVFYIFAIVFFYTNSKGNGRSIDAIKTESAKEALKYRNLRKISLTKPLSEETRPTDIEDIVGQEQGIKALRAALCGPNPQHIIIYGPPGVGKTAAARIILEEAKKSVNSPFRQEAKFVEIDATTLRFDDRSIADPLMGSVHDPIYQGAGELGMAGIPQPKPGAVTEAHGGVLFIDEIGELHPIQMNKLLKVLEDRVVHISSSYYSPEKDSIPRYIHEIFKNGFPADFRLIGATTRNPGEIPSALRSRCTEIFFDPLKDPSIMKICENAVDKIGFGCEKGVVEKIAEYASNGRDCVNIVEMAVSAARMEGKETLTMKNLLWVLESGRHQPKYVKKIRPEAEIGVVSGLAVYSGGMGILIDIEAAVTKTSKGQGSFKITGIIDEEEIKKNTGSSKMRSTAKASADNVVSVLERIENIDMRDYNVHINFPGGIPTDGPSAGTAMFMAMYSALKGIPVPADTAFTGEVSIKGKVLPVGGVRAKAEAAKDAGAKKVFIPKDNYNSMLDDIGIEIKCVSTVTELLNMVFEKEYPMEPIEGVILTAESI